MKIAKFNINKSSMPEGGKIQLQMEIFKTFYQHSSNWQTLGDRQEGRGCFLPNENMSADVRELRLLWLSYQRTVQIVLAGIIQCPVNEKLYLSIQIQMSKL